MPASGLRKWCQRRLISGDLLVLLAQAHPGGHDVHGDRVDHEEADVDHGDDVFDDGEDGDANNYGD